MIPWIGSAYLLTCTASAALYGKISDVFGRKPVLLFSLVVFAGGSVVCSYCRTMKELIIGRAISGIGGGGISSMIYIVISDMVSLRARANYQGIVNTTAGIASMVGPAIGGLLSDKASWRWCFLVNVPIGVLAIIILFFFMSFPGSKEKTFDKVKRMDWIGMILLTGCTVCVVTPLQLGGTIWEWDEPYTIGTFIAAVVLLVAFVVVEMKVAVDPFMPGKLFANPGVTSMFVIAMFMGFLYFAVPYYISLFFQMCYGASAINAGVKTIPLGTLLPSPIHLANPSPVLGVIISSLGGSYYISRTGRHLLLMYIGSVLQIIGIFLITILNARSSVYEQIAYLFITGFGLDLWCVRGLLLCRLSSKSR
ncbi:major facilitator superfamily domain-containing protein [Chytridium lagenaria]|nr:major facilitator superfamily domain-containing protein [Chytridium lagenaria]